MNLLWDLFVLKQNFFVYTWLNFFANSRFWKQDFQQVSVQSKTSAISMSQLVLHKLLHEIWMSILLLIFECATKTVFKTLISDHVKIYPKIVSSNL